MADSPNSNQTEKPKETSISLAIQDCLNKVGIHEGQARRFMSFMIYTLIVFIMLQVGLFGMNTINLSRVKTFSEDIQKIEERLRKDVRANDKYEQLADSVNAAQRNYNGMSSVSFVFLSKLSNQINEMKSLAQQKKDSLTYALQTLPQAVENSLIKIDGAIIYILYGIFILIFGVFTSLNRFHLKQAAKYEHYMVAFQRVRIAGNNANFADSVKASLLVDAFTVESKSPGKKVESPIPGHPTSDVGATLVNKILDSMEVVFKPKSNGSGN